MWKDDSLIPRDTNEAKDGDIFKIIMPWVLEKEEEEKQEKPQKTKAKPMAKPAKG